MSRRVVVTGIGAVTPLGNDISTTWKRLIQGEDAAAPVTLFDTSGCRCKIAASVQVPEVQSKKKSRFSRASRLAISAAQQALEQACLLTREGESQFPWLRISVSSTAGGMALGEAFVRNLKRKNQSDLPLVKKVKGNREGQLFRASHYQAQAQILDLHTHFNFQGPITIIANACASGANAIGHAADLIRSGVAECVLTGGYEELTELLYVGFDSLQALSIDRCRPFDQNRSGLMLGEAAGFLVLESEEHARKRQASILCELAGYGHSTDLHHLTQPNPSGEALIQATNMALSEAKVPLEHVGYLNAHGTGTTLNDASECLAFQHVFGSSSSFRLSSTKAAIGHTLGAAGAIEAIFSIQALLSGEMPPQIHLQKPEPQVASCLVRAGETNPNLKAVMSTNLGFGGSNAALVFTKI